MATVRPVLPSDYEGALRFSSQKLGVPLRRRTSEKAVGPCPVCKGDDRFVVWLFEGSGWCSRCGHTAYTIEREQAQVVSLEARRKRAARQVQLRAEMANITIWQDYHTAALETRERQLLWEHEGMPLADLGRWGLGWCEACPTAPDFPSLTIPVWKGGQLADIRHKLLGADAEEHGKYRSHLAGLMPSVFNVDAVFGAQQLVVVEGEKKAIVMARFGWEGTLGIPGMNVIDELIDVLAEHMQPVQWVTVLFDPGADAKASQLGGQLAALGKTTYVGDCPIKPDDLLLKYGPGVMKTVLKEARRYR